MTVRDAQWYASLPYAIQVVPDVTTEGEECYVAKHPELPGCMAHGGSVTEAIDNLREARLVFLETILEDGLTPPIPAAVQRGYSPTVAILSVIPSSVIPSISAPTATKQTLPSVQVRNQAGELLVAV